MSEAELRSRSEFKTSTPRVRVRECKHGLFTYFPHDIFIGRSLEIYGEYSEIEFSLFERLLKPNMIVLDIGANIGVFTVPLAKLVGPGGRVFAYEPQRIIFQTLCANLAINGVWHAWAHWKAVGDVAGSIGVPPVDYTQPGNFGGVWLSPQTPEMVPLIKLDDEELPSPHFIKVDVEGMELEVLQGARKIIHRHRPILYVENDRDDKSAPLVAALREWKYALYWHCPPMFNKDNWAKEEKNCLCAENGVGYSSFNILCVPAELNMRVTGLTPVEPGLETATQFIERNTK